MSSLWRVLALAWLGAGVPSLPQQPFFPDQIIERTAEGDQDVAGLTAGGGADPAGLDRRAPPR